ncbi:hypothetical protein P3X46_000626 [Hevea brasiliensis]|uniref:Cytochrome P450 n=1 Tax=Hevea brasiliensis TaxID=3981 RepID=A0ABQ9N9Z6_HEVBR|nr:cytochrome P450 81Q32-like [Hevea brasiliensis]KAJ9189316.1 hypothetical protein P3X46_000626 [Hevea brasiliensis]
MEEAMLYAIVITLILVVALKLMLQTRRQRRNLPPSPPSLPIIGHLHLLKQPIHQSLNNLSQKYGPIMSLRLGSRPAIVVSSPSAVEECFTKNDIVLANRPDFSMGRYLNYNNTTLGAARYGDHWRNLRRVCTVEILSSARLNQFRSIRNEEVNALLGRLHRVSSQGFAKVELRSLFFDLTANIIMRMIAGKRYYGEEVKESCREEADKFREIIEKFFAYIEVTPLGDLFPILQWIDYYGFIKKLVRLGEKIDSFLQELIEEHRVDKDRNTMINHLLALQESQPQYYTDEIIKGLILVTLAGGTETSSTALEWAMSNLLNNPNVLKKAKEEINTQIGEERLIDESDLPKLNYLQSIISENLRLCPVAPLLVPHLSSDDCTIGGFHVPSNTIVFVNVWAIQRDHNLWDDPTSFKPERFENGKAEAFQFLPFGLGRRACPGEGLANRTMGLTLGSLIQCFEWERVDGKEIDMAEKTRITMSKVKPLEVLCSSRPILPKVLS